MCLYMDMCIGTDSLGGPGSLELELQMVVNHHMGAGSGTQDVWKSNKCP